MQSLIKWNDFFWEYFETQIASGLPVYFNADEQLLEKAYRRVYPNSEKGSDVSMAFLNDCNAYFVNFTDHVYIKEDAWERGASGRTLSLSLALQQVLAAELMHSDSDFTQNAYFPRYRKLLKIDWEISSCPLPYNQFKNIWSTLKNEVLSVEGATLHSITFYAGDSLRDKHRAYPISQALLSIDDLIIITNNLSQNIEYTDKQLIFKSRKLKGLLSTRGSKLIFNRYLESRILKQISSFEERNKTLKRKKKNKESSETNLLYFYLKEDLFEDIYVLHHQEGKLIKNDDKTLAILKELFQKRDVIIFKLDGDRYSAALDSCILTSDESFLILSNNNQSEPKCPIELYSVQSSLSSLCNLFKSKPTRDSLLIPLQNGSFSNLTIYENKGLSLKGGIRIGLGNTYLVGYGPDLIYYDGIELSISDLVVLNAKQIVYSEFKNNIEKVLSEESWLIEYDHSKIIINFISSIDKELQHYGYSFIPTIDQLEPFSTNLESLDQPCFRFLEFVNVDFIYEDSSEAETKLDLERFMYIPEENWIPIPKEYINNLASYFKVHSKNSGLKRMHRMITSKRMIPKSLYIYLKRNEVI